MYNPQPAGFAAKREGFMLGKKAIIVAVDGPAGSGKSSICQNVCRRLNLTYINTGALYRAIGVLAKQANISLDDENALCQLVEDFSLHYDWDPSTGHLYYRESNLSPQIQQEASGKAASILAKNACLRERLLPLQRQLAAKAPYGALLDGRDIGTVVFPNADIKIFMTASLEQRAKRRLIQLQDKDPSFPTPSLQTVMEDIAKRDHQDSQRATAPLRVASNALVFDNSDLTIEESIEQLTQLIREHLPLL